VLNADVVHLVQAQFAEEFVALPTQLDTSCSCRGQVLLGCEALGLQVFVVLLEPLGVRDDLLW
jgi:hypothetical protein